MRALCRAANLARKHDPCIMIAQAYEILFEPLSTIKSSFTFRRPFSHAEESTNSIFTKEFVSDSKPTFEINKKGNFVDEMDIGQLIQEESSSTGSKACSIELSEKHSRERKVWSPLFMALMKAPRNSVSIALNEWVKENNVLDRSEIAMAMVHLRRMRLFDKALQFVEWLESSKSLDFAERDYASHLDLIAKTDGLQRAEAYIDEIPKDFRGETVYRTLLANCVAAVNVEKAEKVFSRMRELEFLISSFAYNQLLLLYRRIDRRKIPDVLLIMERDGIKPSLFAYMILIDAKGLSRDISGMEKILESMKVDNVVADNALRAMVARHYISAGLNEKAESTLKEMESDCVKENTDAWKFLLPLYASLHKPDDVKRLWKSRESSASIDDFISAIEAHGMLGFVDEAEKIFEKMTKKWAKIPPRSYNALLKVYADCKLVSKGKDLVRKMSDDGRRIGPLTWDAIIKLFSEAGDVEKANSVLKNAAAQSNGSRPLYSSYMTVLGKYAEAGNVHQAERILYSIRQANYPSRVRQYELLAMAYRNGNAPAYGLRERMKADNVYPDKKLLAEIMDLANLRGQDFCRDG